MCYSLGNEVLDSRSGDLLLIRNHEGPRCLSAFVVDADNCRILDEVVREKQSLELGWRDLQALVLDQFLKRNQSVSCSLENAELPGQ